MKLLVDSSAWLEFFLGQDKANKILKLMEGNKEGLYTTTANYYEVYHIVTKDFGPKKREEALAVIKDNATLLTITEAIAREAAEIRLEHGLSAVDAFTLAASRLANAKVLTADSDFKKFPNEAIIV